MASIYDAVGVAASEQRFKKPPTAPRPRYPDTTTVDREPSEPAEVAAFFGMIYVPPGNQED